MYKETSKKWPYILTKKGCMYLDSHQTPTEIDFFNKKNLEIDFNINQIKSKNNFFPPKINYCCLAQVAIDLVLEISQCSVNAYLYS